MNNSEMRRLLKQLRQAGFEVVMKEHIKVYRDGRLVAVAGSSPSDQRSYRNFVSQLKRVGYSPSSHQSSSSSIVNLT